MIDTKKLDNKRLQLVHDLIQLAGGRMILTRTELQQMHGTLRGCLASPAFISKNLAPKRGMKRGRYNLEVFLHGTSQGEKREKRTLKRGTTKKTKVPA